MNARHVKPALVASRCEELSLSSDALRQLLSAVLAKGARFRFRANGFSMSPFLKDGDLVTVAPLPEGPLRHGNIVAFVHPETGKTLVHRVVGSKGGAYLLKGDNVALADGLVPAAVILGIVCRVERNGREVALGDLSRQRLIAFFSRMGFVFMIQRMLWAAGWLRRRCRLSTGPRCSPTLCS